MNRMKYGLRVTLWLALSCSATSALAAATQPECESAERYVAAAREKLAASEFDDAAALAGQAIQLCPSYGGYESLGEARARLLSRADHAKAIDAFVSADDLSTTDTDRAHTLYEYARLLNLDGNPQNAYPLIKAAQGLDPGNPEITALADKIEQRINHPTKDQISRGLWDTIYKEPPKLGSVKTLRPDAAAGGDAVVAAASSPQAGSGRTGSQSSKHEGRSVNIPINFEIGTTMVDEQTRDNIKQLASALADPEHPDQHFLFVGHADVRGIEANNVVLSKRRAEAMGQTVTQLQPSLRGRIDVEGHGSSEPVDPGHDEKAYRANRRLQVLLK